jgi:hypothetical protein
MYPALEAMDGDDAGRRWLYEYLVEKTGGVRLPDRRDIDPSEMRHLLTAINLVDLIRDDGRFRLRYRLVGSLQSYFFAGNRNVTGHFIDDFWAHDPAALSAIETEYRAAVERRAPVTSEFRHSRDKHEYLRYRRTIFPLTNGREEIECFICFHAYESRDAVQGHEDLDRNPVSRKAPPPMKMDD